MNNIENEINIAEIEQWYMVYQKTEAENASEYVDSVLNSIDPDSSQSDIHIVNDDNVLATPLLDEKSIENLPEKVSSDELDACSVFAEYPLPEVEDENEVEGENGNAKEDDIVANPIEDDEECYEDTLSEATDYSSRKSRSECIENAVFPFLTGISLGTLLTICGLSLIYMHSDGSNTDLGSAHNISPRFKSSLERIFSDSCFQESISTMLLEDMYLTNFCERHKSKDCSRRKRFKNNLKKTERRIKQFIRGYDLKALRNKYGKSKKCNNTNKVLEENVFTDTTKDDLVNSNVKMEAMKVFFGPMTEEDYKEERNAEESVQSENDKDIGTEICDIMENTNSKDENYKIDFEQMCFNPRIETITECNSNANSSDFLMKECITSRATNTDEAIGANMEYRKLYNAFIELENEYRNITYNESNASLRARIQETRKTMKEPVEDRYELENRLNHMKEETEKIASIIDKQTKLMHEFSEKANEKLRCVKLRRMVEHNMNMSLHFLDNKENKMADERKNNNRSNRMDSELNTEVCLTYPTQSFGQTIVNELIETTVQNGKKSDESSSKVANDVEDVKTMEHELKQLKEQTNECPYKRYGLTKTILAEKMARKMNDEEHVWLNASNIEKCDARIVWIKKRNDFHKM